MDHNGRTLTHPQHHTLISYNTASASYTTTPHAIGKALVFETEPAAISAGVRKAMTLPYVTRIVFYGDSTSALRSALDSFPHPAQSQSLRLKQSRSDWLDGNTDRNISFKWCPSHTGKYPAERTRRLPRQNYFHAARSLPLTTIGFTRMHVIKEVMNAWAARSLALPYAS